MSKKQLNTDAISNELAGASAFFPAHPKQSPTPKPEPKNEPKTVETIEPTKQRTFQRKIERTNVRNKIRHTFDIFQDQLLSLREIALDREVIFGDRVLLGDLVQEALDMFITKERHKE